MKIGYLIRRLLALAVTLLLVSGIVFGVTQVLPGNAAEMILGQNATPEQLAALERQLGLSDPAIVQYWRWLTGILTGDAGTSMTMGRPVLAVVGTALGRSLVLAGVVLAIMASLAIALGMAAAVRRGRPTDFFVSFAAYLGVCVPEFVVGTLLIILLARPELGWFPAGGYVPLEEGLWPFARHLILPALTLTIILTAHVSRQVRSEMIDVLDADYVRTATLNGLKRRRVLLRYALPNALVATLTILALDIGYLIGGIVVVEEIFAYPGLGRLLLFAIQSRDLPLLQVAVLVMCAVYALANLAADIVQATLDRRIQYA